MYSEDELEAAVVAGVIDRAALDRLRAFRAGGVAPLVDEERFRLVTGFNDIFVAIAVVLSLGALAWLGASMGEPRGSAWFGGVVVAAAAWPLAELFTRRRRLALPSILLLAAFVGGVFGAIAGIGVALVPQPVFDQSRFAGPMVVAIAAAAAAGAAALHWRRFHVPITVAAGVAALVALALALVVAILPAAGDHLTPLAFVAGLGVLAVAMRWDVSDPERATRRADVAFWLHLLAAPLIVHPVFAQMGLLGGGGGIAGAAVVVMLYVAMGVVALAIDRRALMVSALAYVLYALSTLFREFGALSLNAALTGLVLGSALLLLSAYWGVARGIVVAALPEAWRAPLPPTTRTPIPRPA